MNNIFIIHSYNADTKDSFGPYVVEKGTELGFNVIFPDFPIKEEADYKKWSEIMDKYVESGELNEDSIVIAHSLGTHFTPKYIAEKRLPIKLFISVAGFVGYIEREDLVKIVEDFAPNDYGINKAVAFMQNRYAIYSNDDHMNPQDRLELYADKFKAERVFIPNAGHLGARAGIKELPEIFDIIEKVLNDNKQLNVKNTSLKKETTAREDATNLINKYYNGELSPGEYAHELVSRIYVDLVSQAQSGQRLYVEGNELDIKLGHQLRIPNTNKFLNGFRLGRIAVNYHQNQPTVNDFYDPEANITITIDGTLIEEQMDNSELPTGTEVYNGTFKDITPEGITTLEMCVKFSALHFDLYIDKDLMLQFSEVIPQILNQLGSLDSDLPLLEDGNLKKK